VLLFSLHLWVSVCLALYVAFSLELDNAYWAGASAAIVCDPQLGASLHKGWFRMIGTLIGGVAIVLLTACFPQDRSLFLVGLALWGGACAYVATLLRNYASYGAALAGITAVIIANDQLGATGGVNGEAFTLAITRVTEICIGIMCANIVVAGTNFGSARRRLAARFAELSRSIASDFTKNLVIAGSGLPDTTSVRREYIRSLIALDALVDEAFGESPQLRYHSPVLQDAVDGFITALAGWRTVATHLLCLSHRHARGDLAVVLKAISHSLDQAEAGDQRHWTVDPAILHKKYEAATTRLTALPAATPSQRLLADSAAVTIAGLSRALNGFALLVVDPAHPLPLRCSIGINVPDFFPALINAIRACVIILIVALFWIITEWPSGALAITFAAIPTLRFGPRADEAPAAAKDFAIGAGLSAVSAAVIGLAVLPQLETFGAFSLALGLVLIPAGVGIAKSRHPLVFKAVAAYFCPLLAPANQMSYDVVQFYNSVLAVLAGLCTAALFFYLMPSLSSASRIRRLLSLSLRDLRRVAAGTEPSNWRTHINGRLGAMGGEATPLEGAQLLATLVLGSEIIRLRETGNSIGLASSVEPALAAVAEGNLTTAKVLLKRLDVKLQEPTDHFMPQTLLRVRASILAISEVLTRHEEYFATGAAP
jgi:uncharacterized membrane protein YccC